jgi:hypothetical protein
LLDGVLEGSVGHMSSQPSAISIQLRTFLSADG